MVPTRCTLPATRYKTRVLCMHKHDRQTDPHISNGRWSRGIRWRGESQPTPCRHTHSSQASRVEQSGLGEPTPHKERTVLRGEGAEEGVGGAAGGARARPPCSQCHARRSRHACGVLEQKKKNSNNCPSAGNTAEKTFGKKTGRHREKE